MKKVMDFDTFSGLTVGGLKKGALTSCDGVTVLDSGGVKSLLSTAKIDVGVSTPLAGVYSYYRHVDSDYEIQTTPDWIYKNVCPSSVLSYAKGMDAASRMLIADVGKPGKDEDGYRNILAAYSDNDRLLVIYDAVYNIVDQRRTDDYSATGSGYTVLFDSKTSSSSGTKAEICTLTQIWLDVIENGRVESFLVDAMLESRKTLASTYAKSLLVAKSDKVFKYASADYAPSLGESYTVYPDKVYTEIYPRLATDYISDSSVINRERHIVKYSNRDTDGTAYGSLGDKLILLPEMRLITFADGAWRLEAASADFPMLKNAVQHCERFFGYYGDRLYVSVNGKCTDFTPAVDNVPISGGFSTVTSDDGGFTAITSFDGKVVAFTKSSMMTLRGVDLPFSLSFEGAYGCRGTDSLATLGGRLYFASLGGIYAYNGSTVDCISRSLPFGLEYEGALVKSVGNLLAVSLIEYEGLFLYNPQSGCWTWQKGAELDARFPDGMGNYVFYCGEGSGVYRLFSGEGDFDFTVLLGAAERKRICSVTLTAYVGIYAELCMVDPRGKEILKINDAYGDVVTRSVILRNTYTDADGIRIKGKGDVTLLSMQVEYVPIKSRMRRIK